MLASLDFVRSANSIRNVVWKPDQGERQAQNDHKST